MKTNKYILVIALAFFCTVGNLFAVDKSYYNSLDGKSGTALREAMTTLLYNKHTTGLGYNWVFDGIDWDSDGNVYDIYSDCGHTKNDETSSYKCCCDAINREHVVPQSTFNSQYPQYADRHHLFVVDGKVNGYRSDYAFGECSGGAKGSCSNASTVKPSEGNATCSNHEFGKLGTSTFTEVSISEKVYEPSDDYKGDIARAIMYMVIRYATASDCKVKSGSGTGGNSYPVTAWSSSTHCGLMFSSSLSTNYGLSAYGKALLMKWHRNDPVSAKEIARNNGVEAKQGNRNPFVDLPDLAEYLWGTHAGEAVALSSLDIATGSSGGGSSTYQVILNRHGATQTITCTGTYTLPISSTEVNACEGWPFAGWTTSSNYSSTTAPAFTTSVSAATTLYAVYSNTGSSAPMRKAAAADISTLTFTAACGGSGTADDGAAWIVTSDGTESNFDNTAGIHYGTNSKNVTYVQLSTSDIGGTITQVVVNCRDAQAKATVSVTVGGTAFTCSGSATATNTSSDYTFTGSASGAVVVRVDRGSSMTKAIYVKSVAVTYTSAGGGGGTTTTTTYKTSPECGTAHTISLSNGGSATGGDFVADVTEAYSGTTVTLTAYPNEGFSFSSWTVTKAGGGTVSIASNQFTMPDADVTVSATFTENPKYTIRFYNNGSVISTQSVYLDSEPEVPSNPTACDGYEFVGWYTSQLAANNTSEEDWITDFTVTGAQDYYAVFSRTETSGSGGAFDGINGGTFKIYAQVGNSKYYAKGTGSKINSTTYENEATEYTITPVAGVTKGFTIKTGNDYITYSSSTNLGTSAKAYTWTLETGTHGTWRVNSGTSGRALAFSVDNSTNKFGGYSTGNIKDGSNYYDLEISNGSTSTTYYTSSPECITPCTNTPTMLFANTNVELTTDDATYTQAVTISNKGAGQMVTYSSSDETVATVNASGVVTLLGKIGSTTITASVAEDGDYCKASASYTITVTKAPCVLTGISLNTEDVSLIYTTGDVFSTDELIVTADYSNCASSTVTPTSISSPDMSTAGTKTITVSYTENGTTKTATYSITVSAPISYSITLDNNGSVTGGTFMASAASATAGTTITLTATAATGYRFVSWSVTQGSTSVEVNNNQFTMPAGDVTVSATFETIPQYVIRFFDNGSQIGNNQSVYEGSLPDVPAAPTPCDGYTFVGWWTEELASTNTESKSWVTDFTVNKNQDYYAIYEQSGEGGGSSTVTFEKSDFSGSGTISASKSGVVVSCVGNIPSGAYVTFTESNTLTIISSSGNITAIDFTCTESAYTGNMEDVSNISTSSWSITVDNPGTKTTVRVSSIVVTICSGSSSTTYYTSSPVCVTPCTKLETPVVAAVGGNEQITLTWAEVEGADHYTVAISTGVGYTTECGSAASISTITNSNGINTCVITGLTNGLTYTTSVVAHATDETCDSDADEDTTTPLECNPWVNPTLTWSTYRLSTTGTATATLTVTGTEHGTRTYESSDTNVLTVANDGTVTAVAPGTATITVLWAAADGYCEKSVVSSQFEVSGSLTITFNKNDGTQSPETTTQTVTYNVEATLAANTFMRTGYTFAGWATEQGGAKVYDDEQSVTIKTSLTLYAVWTVNSHNVSFSSPTGATVTVNGQSDSPQTVAFGETVTVSVTPAAHYTLGTITISTGGEVTINGNTGTFTMPDADVAVTVTIIEETKYTVNWYVLGTPTAEMNYAGEALAGISVSEIECNGKVFVGWTTSSSYDGDDAPADLFTDPASKTMPSNNSTNYYAVFAMASGDGGGASTTLLSEDFASITSGNNTSTSGSSSAWSGNDNIASVSTAYQAGGAVKLGGSSTTGSITTKALTASAGSTLTVAFDVKGWTTVEGNIQISVTGCDAQTITYTATMSGSFETKYATFTLVSANPTVTIATTAKRAFIDNLVISSGDAGSSTTTYSGYTTSCVTPTEVTVTFDANGGEGTMSSQVMPYNETTTLNANTFTRTGYTFTGWNSLADGSGTSYADEAEVKLTRDITLYAQWKGLYAIRFFDNGDKLSEQTVMEGETATLPNEPNGCTGYPFVGWWTAELATDNTTSHTWINDVTATQDQDYYAVYSHSETSGGVATTSNESVTFSDLYSTNTTLNQTTITIGTHASVIFDKGSNSNAPQYYTTGSAIRIYGGGTCVVSTDAGNITAITLTFSSGEGTNNITANVGTYSDGSWSGEASSVTFNIEGSSGHRRIAGIAVTISNGGSTTTTNYTTAPECPTYGIVMLTELSGASIAVKPSGSSVDVAPMIKKDETYYHTSAISSVSDITWQLVEHTRGCYIQDAAGNYLNVDGTSILLGTEQYLWHANADGRFVTDDNTGLCYSAIDKTFVVESDEAYTEDESISPCVAKETTDITLNEASAMTRNDSKVQNGYYATLCLPFAVPSPMLTGATAFNVVGKRVNNGVITGVVMVEETGILTAGKPYVIQYTDEQMDAWYAPEPETVTEAVAAIGLVGNLSTTPIQVPVGCYGLSNNQLRKVAAEGVATVGQYKAYFDLSKVPDMSELTLMPAYRVMYTTDMATDIESVSGNQGINWNEPVYNILGIRVSKDATGVLIQNGTKYVVSF